MKVAAVLGLAALGALAAAARRVRAAVSPERARHRGPRPSPAIRALIEREAVAQGLAPEIALVFAELESGFNPNAYGDRDWAYNHPTEWQATRQRLPENPAVDDPSAWGSYGLFGLLAALHVAPHENPQVLWDAALNAHRGVATIKQALDRTHGDLRAARLLYVGCGADGSRCSRKYLVQTEARLRVVAQKWLTSADALQPPSKRSTYPINRQRPRERSASA
jgi:hypothetical protein